MPKLGFKHTQETRKRMSLSRVGNTNGFKPGQSPWNKGKSAQNDHRIASQERNHKWRGGVQRHSDGYILVKSANHPCGVRGYVYEHRMIVEKVIGRYLLTTEIVHHINKIRDDNRIENLMVFNNDGEHRAFDRGYHIDKKYIIFDGRELVGVK